ncbi:MAG: methyltransferase [Ruminococcus sp.]|nr:methyltransferase [Ruminococcus sp.]
MDISLNSDLSVESLGDGIEICISAEHRFGTDAFLLADFAGARHKDLCADFCTGSGIIALLMHKNFRPRKIFALEIQPKAHELLKLSIQRSGIETIQPVLGDLKEWKSPMELDLVTCNPPYKINNTGLKNDLDAVSIARHEMLCTVEDVCAAAARVLKFGGRLCICNRPERLCDVLTAMRSCGLEPKRLRTVHKNPDCPPWLILVEGRKGGRNFMQIEKPLYVRSPDGGNSQEMKRIYKLI